jgi:hypothetical protein
MMCSKASGGRRALLAGFSAAAFLGPLASVLVREARGQPPPRRRRLVIFTFANGFEPVRYRGTVRSENDFDLTPVLAPLGAHKQELLVLEPFFNRAGVNLHGNYGEVLTARSGGPSIDRFVARRIGGDDPMTSLALSMWLVAKGPMNVSRDEGGQVYPAEWNPIAAYEKVAGIAPGTTPASGAATEDLLRRRKSLLDFVTRDIGALRARLPAVEAARLDQYVESLRSFEMQAVRLAGARTSCGGKPPALGAAAAGAAGRLSDAKYGPGTFQTEMAEALVDLAGHALACNLTRVISICMMGNPNPNHSYPMFGVSNYHQTCHANDNAKTSKIDALHMSMVARLWERLKQTPEGGGTLADNSIVLTLNSSGGRHHTGSGSHPAFILGGRSVVRGGRWLTVAGKRSIGDLFAAVATAVGAATNAFGDPADSQGPLPGLA